MPSFNNALDQLVSVLTDYPALVDFSVAKWSKPVSVKRMYRKRTEIGSSELPIILVVRPEVVKDFKLQARDGKHSVNLYLSFLQNDREKAQAELIEVEEIIDDAILANYTLNQTVQQAMPGRSDNDEGQNHPVYGLAMSVDITHRR